MGRLWPQLRNIVSHYRHHHHRVSVIEAGTLIMSCFSRYLEKVRQRILILKNISPVHILSLYLCKILLRFGLLSSLFSTGLCNF
jgi:hypothetical protein